MAKKLFNFKVKMSNPEGVGSLIESFQITGELLADDTFNEIPEEDRLVVSRKMIESINRKLEIAVGSLIADENLRESQSG